jgi:hypothetical protein
MVDRRGHARFALEALAKLGIAGMVAGDHLQRDGALEVQLHGAIDDAHPAACDDLFDAAAAQQVARGQLGHGVMSSRLSRIV